MEADVLLMLRVGVSTESQPAALVRVWVYTPELLYVVPCQVYVLHALATWALADVLLMVRFTVMMESQPAAFKTVSMYWAEVVQVWLPLGDV